MSENKKALCTDDGTAHSYAETGETEVEDMFGNVETYRTWQCTMCNAIGISAKPKKYEDDVLVFVHTLDSEGE